MADYSFISQNQQSPALQNASGVLGLAEKAQQIQRTGITLQRDRQVNDERIATQNYMRNPTNWQDENGNIDVSKANAALTKIAPLTGAETIGKLTELSTAQTAATQAKLNFSNSERSIVGGLYGVLGRAGISDPKIVAQELDNLKSQYPDFKEIHKYVDNAKVGLRNMQPGPAVPKTLVTQSQALLGPSEQQSALTPTASLRDMGGSTNQVVTQPSVGGAPPSATIGTTGTPNTLPPTTQQFNPVTNAPETVGTTAPTATTPGQHVQTGPALGQIETAAGVSLGAIKDWTSVQDAAKNAQQDIGVLQEIKKYVPGAVTGVENDRRAFLSGIAGLLGMDAGQLAKTDTDLLAKNANMLALAGGDTNLARTMAEAANPNTHMTPQAIAKAANQVIAQRQLAIERQQFLLPYINNPQEYTKQQAKFNAVADPRILQLPSLSVAEKIAMKKAMSPAERDEFSRKIGEMQKMGILR